MKTESEQERKDRVKKEYDIAVYMHNFRHQVDPDPDYNGGLRTLEELTEKLNNS